MTSSYSISEKSSCSSRSSAARICSVSFSEEGTFAFSPSMNSHKPFISSLNLCISAIGEALLSAIVASGAARPCSASAYRAAAAPQERFRSSSGRAPRIRSAVVFQQHVTLPRITLHWLRHTFISLMYLASVDVLTAKV